MPSHLRLQVQFEPFAANITRQTSPTSPPAKKQRMSLTQTYYVASTARSKLGREAGRADHNLRRLVGHANLLDNLMAELQDAERAQEAWFHQSVSKANKTEEPKHITWVDQVDTIMEEDEEEDSDSDSDAEYEIDDDAEIFNIPVGRAKQPPVELESAIVEDDSDYDEEEDEGLALRRSPSRHSPPELVDDDESESEDEMPSSPESQEFQLDEKTRQAITTTAFYDTKTQRGLEDYIMQHAQQQQAPLIAAY
ncbi:hypothetical protein BAUCODRAFT_77372 [Baudoinia panamericana UAMH 10762]|uniref:Uncharacterized protein n=1 Tax=Baudoinia panamericana (strain UAMH 10762) TaxID=717646 RepID=M2N1U5_BAUPA|nr:uncharacterized protein BAUCODRAFT_77372 [Baudoinia panamericana UAMH 10762]EMC92625.1 hypothetical protein BAUCODRAFT_77372 [Baudoinia panamericana UAMH 10762]